MGFIVPARVIGNLAANSVAIYVDMAYRGAEVKKDGWKVLLMKSNKKLDKHSYMCTRFTLYYIQEQHYFKTSLYLVIQSINHQSATAKLHLLMGYIRVFLFGFCSDLEESKRLE